MKIYMIGQKGIPARAGGIERHVEELSTRLAARGYEVVVYCRGHYTPRDMKAYRGVRLVHLPTLQTKHLDAIIHTLFATLHVLREPADIIHYHGVGPALLLWIVRLLKPRTEVVFTFHCQDYHHQKWSAFAQLMLRCGEAIGVRMANRIITVSQTLTKYVWVRYLREAIYIPNGAAPLPVLDAGAHVRAFGLQTRGYILAVARLVRHKGIHELMDAYERLPATTTKLVIAGDGAYTDDYVQELKRRAAANPNIQLLGDQPAEVLQDLYRNAAFVVQPSHAEGLSIVLLEAMHYGACVLTSDIPENREVVRDGGYCFRTGSVNDLVAKLQFLLSHPELWTRSGSALQGRATREYAWDPITEKTIALYEDLLRDRARGVRAPSVLSEGVRAHEARG